MPPGSDVRCNYSFHMATEFTASQAHMSGLSLLFSLLSHPITYPTNHWPLTSLLQSVHLPFPLSVAMKQKSKTQACTWSVSQQCGHRPKQIGIKFANLFSSDERPSFQSTYVFCKKLK